MSILRQRKRRIVAASCAEICTAQLIVLATQYNKEKLTHGDSKHAEHLSARMDFWARSLVRYGRLSRGKNPWRTS